MDVTRSNFSKIFSGLEKVISESSFLAIDGEFTGLIDGGPDVAAYDTYSEYYGKLKNGSLNFLFIQFGLCAFKYDAEKEKWVHTAYNFYTFPKQFCRQAEDSRFLCQSSSIDFLATNGFDFNKLFREGISYLTLPEEQKMRLRLEEKHAQLQRNGTPGRDSTIPVPEDQSVFVKETCAKIEAFIALPDGPVELQLPRCSAFQRKLIYQSALEKYSTDVRLETRADGDARNFFALRLGSEDEMKRIEAERNDKEFQELEEAVGFSKVIRLLAASGKLIVGHNMMLDMMHVLNQFCAPVPDEYSEFKDMLHTSFPRLLDTKYMSGCTPFKETIRSNSLSDLFIRLSEEPFTMPTVECESLGSGYPSLANKYHEAGYDALITGLCALAMATHLDPKMLHPDITTLPRLHKYLNKIMLFRMQDFGYVDLRGKDPVLPRDHVFHVTIPKEWKQHDVVKLFQPVGPVFVSWVNDTTVFVALHEREKAACVFKTLPRSPSYRVTSYAAHQTATANANAQGTAANADAQGSNAALHGAVQKVPESPTVVERKRRSLEKLAEAGEADKRRRKAPPTVKESKYSRRSIDPIAEERETASPSTTPHRTQGIVGDVLRHASLFACLHVLFVGSYLSLGTRPQLAVIASYTFPCSLFILYLLPPRHGRLAAPPPPCRPPSLVNLHMFIAQMAVSHIFVVLYYFLYQTPTSFAWLLLLLSGVVPLFLPLITSELFHGLCR